MAKFEIEKMYPEKLEKGLLALCLFSESRDPELLSIAEILNPSDFYSPLHQELAEIIKKTITRNNGRLDYETVIVELEKKFPESRKYVQEMLESDNPIVNDPNIAIKKIQEFSIKRDIISTCQEYIWKVSGGKEKIEELIDDLQKKISSIQIGSDNTIVSSFELSEIEMDEIDNEMREREENPNKKPDLIFSGYTGYDKCLGGFSPGTFNLIAGRPGMGKTTFACNLALNISLKQVVVFFSIEMTRKRLNHKFMAKLGQINTRKFKGYDFSKKDFHSLSLAQEKLYERKNNLFIDDISYLTPELLIKKAKFYNKKLGASVFFIDYIQNMSSSRITDPTERVSTISKAIQRAAKETGTVFFPLAQLNRKLEERADKRPIIADLKQSGQLEQDADTITFLYRDCVYKVNPTDIEKMNAELIVAKNRDGSIGVVDMTFMPETASFFDRRREHV